MKLIKNDTHYVKEEHFRGFDKQTKYPQKIIHFKVNLAEINFCKNLSF